LVYVDHLFGEFDKSVVELTHPAYRRQALALFLQHAGSKEGDKKERHPGLDPGSPKWQSKTNKGIPVYTGMTIVDGMTGNDARSSRLDASSSSNFLIPQFLINLSPIFNLMKRFLTLAVLILLTTFSSFAQENTALKHISYTQLFERIAAEKDTVFRLSNTIIDYNPATDKKFSHTFDFESQASSFERTDTIVVNKALDFENVQFTNRFGGTRVSLNHIKFLKPVLFNNTLAIHFRHCKFEETVFINSRNPLKSALNWLVTEENLSNPAVAFEDSHLEKSLDLQLGSRDFPSRTQTFVTACIIKLNNDDQSFMLWTDHIFSNGVDNNKFIGKGNIQVWAFGTELFTIYDNDFSNQKVEIRKIRSIGSDNLVIEDNKFDQPVTLEFDVISNQSSIFWNQFQPGIISNYGYASYVRNVFQNDSTQGYFNILRDPATVSEYQKTASIEFGSAFKEEIKLRGLLFDLYKRQHDSENANAAYINLKNLETARLGYLYTQNPSFGSFFKWKVNQFLKVFSDYGTEPSKAIVFSVNVIFLFALIYLFFPNHWDSHGKNRIMDRYRFFLKYVNKDSGIHEVYLEEQKHELLNAEDFKTYLLEQGKTAPKFFMATALPLYKWSVAGTKSASWLLSKVDVLKGKWSETEDSKRSGKSFLLITAFLIALTYDIFIKMLNALMLSINTFTTLGFGEIPIKGLPRYLAIIQGFIGWFMLTIFSVSLISQLLN